MYVIWRLQISTSHLPNVRPGLLPNFQIICDITYDSNIFFYTCSNSCKTAPQCQTLHIRHYKQSNPNIQRMEHEEKHSFDSITSLKLRCNAMNRCHIHRPWHKEKRPRYTNPYRPSTCEFQH